MLRRPPSFGTIISVTIGLFCWHLILVRWNISYALIWKNLSGSSWNRVNLNYRDLRGVKFRGTSLAWANLRQANLTQVDLTKSKLIYADLAYANLQDTSLYSADLSVSNLRGANLRGADMRHSDLSAAELFGADLTGAKLSGAILKQAYYDQHTRWPRGFKPTHYGAVFRAVANPDSGPRHWSFPETWHS